MNRIYKKQWRSKKRRKERIDSTESINDGRFLDGLDLDGVLGQQLVMWSYTEPDTLNLFTPVLGDNLATVFRLTQETLHFDPNIHKLMILKAGTNHPIDISQFHCVEPGSAIITMPRDGVRVHVEIKQLHMKFDMDLDLTMTVLQLKYRLQSERGLAEDRLDLLFKDRPMENRQYLFNYKIQQKCTLFVMIHIHYDILVHVDTFWGNTYHLYLDPCMTGMNVIWNVLRRTVTKNTPDLMALFDLYLPKHTLVLYHRHKVVNWNTCLGYYNIDDNDTLKLSTIGLYHKLSLQKVPIFDDAEKMQTVKVSMFDRWSTVALKLHGIIGVSLNLIQIYCGRKQVDLSEAIGQYTARSTPITMDLSLSKADPDVLYGVSLNFRLGKDVTEIIKVSSKRTVHSVKYILEQLGVPNASVYDMYMGDRKLSNNEKIITAVEDLQVPVDLKLTQYPVFIHTTHKTIYRMQVYAQETVAAFKKRIEMKSGLSLANHKLLLAGEDFTAGDELCMFDTRIGIRSSIFILPRVLHDTFFILYDNYMLKVKVPQKPTSEQLKQLLWQEMTLPSGALASVGVFLQWYYTGRGNHTTVNRRHPKKHHHGPSASLPRYQKEDFSELRPDFRQQEDTEHMYPYKPLKKESNPVMRMFHEKERIHDRSKNRSCPYPANIFPSYESFKDRNRNEKVHGYRSDDKHRKALRRHRHQQYYSLDGPIREHRLLSPRREETLYLKL